MKPLSILYRGSLVSCNYGCPYCPFAKRRESPEEHAADARALARFVEWVATQRTRRVSVLFTPWGEALIHGRYQRAFILLSHMPHVEKVSIQTNLSGRLEWVEHCNKKKIALWTTFHPGEVTLQRFLSQCRELDQRSVRYSVGVVGLKEHLGPLEALRAALPREVYVWVNAYKRLPDYYTPAELKRLTEIDPFFLANTHYYPSQGRDCRAGYTVISVYGDGTAQRCHFIKEPIGNIYEAGFLESLHRRPCTKETCHCHIGYVHMDDLNLYTTFGAGILERIPEGWPFTSPQ